jgi:exosome complex RNA-binding protein Rrp4
MCKIFNGPTTIMLASNGDVFIGCSHKDQGCVYIMQVVSGKRTKHTNKHTHTEDLLIYYSLRNMF